MFPGPTRKAVLVVIVAQGLEPCAWAQFSPPLWVHQQVADTGYEHTATVIRVDAEGNAYCVGSHRNASPPATAVLYKLNSDGGLLWSDSLPATYLTALRLDDQGRAVVAGQMQVGNDINAFVARFGPDGHPDWSSTYGSSAGADKAADVALDSDGNVFITGVTFAQDTGSGLLTVKFQSDGDLLWARRLFQLDGGGGGALAMALDAAGNCYITGASVDTVAGSIITVSYGPDGTQRWLRRAAPPHQSQGCLVAVQDDRVIVSGAVAALGDEKIICLAYDTAGALIWQNELTDPPRSFPKDMCLGPDGSAYVTGVKNIGNSWYNDIVTEALAPDGSTRWVRTHDGGIGFDYGTGVALASNGHVFVNGYGPDTLFDDRSTMVTLAYDQDGDLIGQGTYALSGNDVISSNLGLDGAGNAYAFGSFCNVFHECGLVTIKYGTDLPLSDATIAAHRRTGPLCYPNPSRDRLHIDLPGETSLIDRVIIVDMEGRVVQEIPHPLIPVSLNVSDLQNGVYAVYIRQGTTTARTRFVVGP